MIDSFYMFEQLTGIKRDITSVAANEGRSCKAILHAITFSIENYIVT